MTNTERNTAIDKIADQIVNMRANIGRATRKFFVTEYLKTENIYIDPQKNYSYEEASDIYDDSQRWMHRMRKSNPYQLDKLYADELRDREMRIEQSRERRRIKREAKEKASE